MPLIYEDKYSLPYLVYDAPVDEKTKKLRKLFKVDENTEYPESYNWRNAAKLGKSYRPEDPFIKFQFKKEENYQDTAEMIMYVIAASSAIHYGICYLLRKPIWAKPFQFLFMTGGASYLCYWSQYKSIERQAMRSAAVVEYARQHPERFGEIQRYKVREVLTQWVPRR